jgi:hypothetical protein
MLSSVMNASANKSKLSLFVLLALGVSVGWASVETYRLWVATQLVAASQQQEIRVAAKLDAARAKHYQLANTDPSARPAPNPK